MQAMLLHTGDTVELKLPSNELMDCIGVAGEVFEVKLLEDGVQLYQGGMPFALPVSFAAVGMQVDENTGLPFAYGAQLVIAAKRSKKGNRK